MMSPPPSYHGYRFPPEIIGHAVWLYHRFCLSFRDTEDLLVQRGITVTYETIRHGIVKLRMTALPDAQHGLFPTGSSPVSWGSVS